MASDLKTCSACDKVYYARSEVCPHCRGRGPTPTPKAAEPNSGWKPVVLVAVALVSAFLWTAWPRSEPVYQKSAADTAAENARAVAERKLAERESAELEDNLRKVTPTQIREILTKCSSAIQALADKSGSKFGSFIVDEDSADAFQVAAASMSGSLDFSPVYGDERRVKDFIKVREEHHPEYLDGYLNLGHIVLFTGDTFSGFKKFPVKYECALTPKLEVVAEKK